MTFPAVLQAGKLRPREGSDLSETSQSQAKATHPLPHPDPSKVHTPTHALCLETGQTESLIYFSYLAPTAEGVVSLIHSAHFPWGSAGSPGPGAMLSDTGAQRDLSPRQLQGSPGWERQSQTWRDAPCLNSQG